MCSVVIVRFGDIVCVTMNRDEFRARVPELPPARWSSGLIAPRDGLGQGTWIGVMPDGAWACLLNSYEPVNVSARRPSRGLLVPAILAANDPEQLLHNLDLSNYMPFRLLVGSKMDAALHHWDGKTLQRRAISTMPYFISSSLWQAERVLAERATTFKMWQQANMPHDRLGRPLLHLWQEPQSPETGILMERSETHTTSMTQLRLGSGQSQDVQYWPSHHLVPIGRDAFLKC